MLALTQPAELGIPLLPTWIFLVTGLGAVAPLGQVQVTSLRGEVLDTWLELADSSHLPRLGRLASKPSPIFLSKGEQ